MPISSFLPNSFFPMQMGGCGQITLIIKSTGILKSPIISVNNFSEVLILPYRITFGLNILDSGLKVYKVAKSTATLPNPFKSRTAKVTFYQPANVYFLSFIFMYFLKQFWISCVSPPYLINSLLVSHFNHLWWWNERPWNYVPEALTN